MITLQAPRTCAVVRQVSVAAAAIALLAGEITMPAITSPDTAFAAGINTDKASVSTKARTAYAKKLATIKKAAHGASTTVTYYFADLDGDKKGEMLVETAPYTTSSFVPTALYKYSGGKVRRVLDFCVGGYSMFFRGYYAKTHTLVVGYSHNSVGDESSYYRFKNGKWTDVASMYYYHGDRGKPAYFSNHNQIKKSRFTSLVKPCKKGSYTSLTSISWSRF